MVGSDKGHMADDVIMMQWYDGDVARKFGILRGDKGPKQGDTCHH